MAQSFEKVKIAADDINLDTAGHGGSAVGGFTRKLSTGAVGQNPNTLADWNKFGADYVPHRDEPLITGANQPFNRITAADRDSERLMREMRINTPNMYNFEACGGIPGTGRSPAEAAKNTEVWDKILSLIAVSGEPHNGIFFPGTTYEFMEWGGTPLYANNTTPVAAANLYGLHVLPMNLLDNITLRGASGGTILKKNSNANTAYNLLFIQDSSGFSLENITLDVTGGTGGCAGIQMYANTVSVSGAVLYRVKVLAGSYGFFASLNNAPGNLVFNQFDISQCVFNGNLYGVALQNTTDGWIDRNTFLGTPGTDQGISIVGSGDPELLGGLRIVRNNVGVGKIRIDRAGNYLTAHKDFTIYDNSISSGSIEVLGVNEFTIQGNQLFNGGVYVSLGAGGQTSAHNIHILDNFIEGGNTNTAGIILEGTGCTLNGFSIQGGRINNVKRHGVYVTFTSGVAKWGDISRVFVLNNSREGTGTNYSSIYFGEGNATGGVMETQVHDNILRNFGAATHPQEYGIECQNNGGLTDYILTSHNYVKGRNNAAKVLTRGANSGTDEPAAWDGGTATT